MSDLGWMPNSAGYLTTLLNVDEMDEQTTDDFLSLLPAIVDRWRSQSTSFYFVVVGKRNKRAVLEALASDGGARKLVDSGA
jgi:hypothetical protein